MIAHPLHPSERGSIVVEFAISVIVLVILVFGCIGVCMAFYTYEVINEYARDASRYAIVHGNGCNSPVKPNCAIGPTTSPTANSTLTTYLNNQIYPGINGTKLHVTATYTFGPGETTCSNPGVCNGPGDQVTVRVSYPYLYKIPFIPQRLITMHASSTMIISQ